LPFFAVGIGLLLLSFWTMFGKLIIRFESDRFFIEIKLFSFKFKRPIFYKDFITCKVTTSEFTSNEGSTRRITNNLEIITEGKKFKSPIRDLYKEDLEILSNIINKSIKEYMLKYLY